MSTPNIVLIGMPGAGKSTIGILLAKMLGYDFVDTDILIQTREAMTLQAILDQRGYQSLRAIEAEVIQAMQLDKTVIATGGSAVYGNAAMTHLKDHGICIFLDVPLNILQQRINDEESRGIARQPGESFADVFAERLPLYRQYADITVDASQKPAEQICETIIRELGMGD